MLLARAMSLCLHMRAIQRAPTARAAYGAARYMRLFATRERHDALRICCALLRHMHADTLLRQRVVT